ncbi:MAG: ribonuclease HII [Candidatus Omnitrophica bacterium]|nr:ribonuclease HII [Candidatus Omnitrophota bacterium]
MLYYERIAKKQGYRFVIGVDEAGRGPLAGPVVAAAVVLRSARFHNRVDDSKKLSALQRERAFREIVQQSFFGIGIVSEAVIDAINILEATKQAMQKAIRQVIERMPDPCAKMFVLIDGNCTVDVALPCAAIVKGDTKSLSIASASIVAKVTRDRIMAGYDRVYPHYGFIKHKGYPTKMHREALITFGPSLIHRMSFLT